MLRQFHRTVLEKREIVCVCCKSYFLFIEMEWFFNVKKFYRFLYSWGNKIILQFYLLWKTTKQFCTAQENIKVIVQVADIFPYQSVRICVWPGSSAWRRL